MSPDGSVMQVRALLDCEASNSLVMERLAKRQRLPRRLSNFKINAKLIAGFNYNFLSRETVMDIFSIWPNVWNQRDVSFEVHSRGTSPLLFYPYSGELNCSLWPIVPFMLLIGYRKIVSTLLGKQRGERSGAIACPVRKFCLVKVSP